MFNSMVTRTLGSILPGLIDLSSCTDGNASLHVKMSSVEIYSVEDKTPWSLGITAALGEGGAVLKQDIAQEPVSNCLGYLDVQH